MSITILLQLKPVFTTDQPEFRIIPLSQYLEKLLETETESVHKYFNAKDQLNQQRLTLTTNQFRTSADSLLQMMERNDTRSLVEALIAMHHRYEDYIKQQTHRIQSDRTYDPLPTIGSQVGLTDSIRQRLHVLNEAYLPTLSKALKRLNQQTSDAISGGYYILLLALAIGSVLALLIARNVTKPIQALKAGTERVGEGHYETVAVTTYDEIADLTNAFNLMSEKLKQLDEMRAQLMSEISHEMRTPLQVIKAGCYSIVHTKDGTPLTQRQRDAVGMIHQATNRINQFVNSFLDVAKMEAGLMKFKFESANLFEVLNPLIQEAQLIAQTRQIDVEFLSDQIPSLIIDKERIGQVFSNLLSNALKYTPDDGLITIRMKKSNDCGDVTKNGHGCVVIDVQDSGVGIPETDLPKLFQKFYQAKNVPLVNEKGSGLGLALVKHVAEAHGGRVSVKSQVGAGSTFTITLPA
ncbi:MAG: HAMP domain-containing histidine kinase [Ignavibacteria bacterium]|nr:HAMP domain-containing histidine kinase [Ignavibacteria bacterium]MBI3765438.1 HAMP domain-containing histidine kinase [Ignavibacteriales bacterium]